MVGGLILAIHHTIAYGKKVKNKAKDNVDQETLKNLKAQESMLMMEMNNEHKMVLVTLVITITILVFGVLKHGWYFAEISALFMGMALAIGCIIFKRNFEAFASEFLKGAGEMTTAAIFIGLSRAILVVMEDGKIMDTIVHGLSIPLTHLNSVVAAWGMYVVQGFINFLIPSSTGQAVVVMPIMSSLSDLIGVTRQVAVLAFQAGDGYWNMITPTHSVLMASLGLAGVSFNKWFKFAFTLVMKWCVWILIVLATGILINWGPF